MPKVQHFPMSSTDQIMSIARKTNRLFLPFWIDNDLQLLLKHLLSRSFFLCFCCMCIGVIQHTEKQKCIIRNYHSGVSWEVCVVV